MQVKLTYHEDTVDEYSSLGNVIRRRPQFSEASKKKKEFLEKKLKISMKEREQYVQVEIDTTTKVNANFMEKGIVSLINEDDDEDEEKQGFSWKALNQLYEQSIHTIKDEKSFKVHGKVIKFSKDSLGVFGNK